MSAMSRRHSGSSGPPRLAAAVGRIGAMAAHPWVVLQVTWIEELPVPQSRADTAMRLARYFGGDARSWLNLQAIYDLHRAEIANARRIDREIMPIEV